MSIKVSKHREKETETETERERVWNEIKFSQVGGD